jgi:hypothetical protein
MSGFLCIVNGILALLVSHAVQTGAQRRFGITYQISMKMEPIVCPETSINYYEFTLHNIPEERRSSVNVQSETKKGELLKTQQN